MTSIPFVDWFVEYVARHATATAAANGYTLNTTPHVNTRNAIAHAHVSATWTRDHGRESATDWGNAKEKWHPNNNPADLYKDQFNNEVGRRVADWMEANGYTTANYTKPQLDKIMDDLIIDAINEGKLIIDLDDPRINTDLPDWDEPSENWEDASAGRDYEHDIQGTGTSDIFLPNSWTDGDVPDTYSPLAAGDVPIPIPTSKPHTPNADGIPLPLSKPPVPPWLAGPVGGFPESKDTTTPLVIDLDADGIELTEFDAETTATFFDIDNDGFAEQTAWIAANQDGFLARDINQDGVINNAGELFGSATVDGFAILSALDSNNDLVIDQYDDAWDELVIWKDIDGDAYTDDGELLTLASQDIINISLTNITASTSVIEGNPISHTSTVTKVGGTTATIVDAWFVHDNVNTFYDQDVALDIRALMLPTLRGFGNLPDLHIAMSIDEDLLALVEDFYLNFEMAALDDLAGLTTQFEDILFRWAGVDGLSPTGRGEYIDGRKLAFMEAMFDDQWVSNIHGIPNPYQQGAAILQHGWNDIYSAFTAQLAFQAGTKVLFDPTTVFNPFLGDFEGDRLLVEAEIDNLVPLATAMGVDPVQFWLNTAQLIQGVKPFDELTIDENQWIEDAIDNSTNLIDWDGIKDLIEAAPEVNSQFGNFYDPDVLFGANDVNDTLTGYGGNDILYGLSGDDTLDGGEGDDFLYGGDGGDTIWGGNGSDTYVYEYGNHTYSEQGTSGTDVIYFGTGIEFSDLSFAWTNGYSMSVIIDGRGTIELQYQIGIWNPGFETFAFADAVTTYNVADVTITALGTDGYDAINDGNSANPISHIYAFGGDDNITSYGTTIVDAGAGNDYIGLGHGGTLVFGPGFDSMGIGGDYTIEIPAEFDANDVTLLRINPSNGWYDLLIQVQGLGQLKINSVFGWGQTVEQITFANGIDSAIDLHTADILFAGTNGNDTFSTSTSMIFTNDHSFLFGTGDDIVSDYEGTDRIIFGAAHNLGNLEIYQVNRNLVIEDTEGNSLTVNYHFQPSYDYYFIEELAFNSTVTDMMTIEIETRGTEEAENIYGIAGRDASDDDLIYAYGGNDYIWAYNGADTIYAGTGNDYVGTDDNLGDTVHLGEGNDTFYSSGSSADDLVYGEAGTDTINAYGGEDVVYGGADADNIDGGAGEDTLYGDAGEDYIWGGAGNDTLYGGGDDDLLDGADDNDTIYGGAGEDDIRGNFGDDILYGEGGDDLLFGRYGADTFAFKAGDVGNGVDTITDFTSWEGDIINLVDILGAEYDPLTEAITDFVQITDNGSHSFLAVDVDGGANSFVQIAQISNVIGLTDEEALETGGYLIAA